MEVKFTNLGAAKVPFEFPPGLFDMDLEQMAEYGRLATEPHTNELYQEIIDRCYPLDGILDQLAKLETCLPTNSRITKGIYVPFAALYNVVQQQNLSSSPESPMHTRQFSVVCMERYAFAAALCYGGELPRNKQLAFEIDKQRDLLEQSPHIDNGVEDTSPSFVLQFGSELVTAVSMRDTLLGYNLKYKEKNEAAQLKFDNDALFESARFLQRYQLKSALVSGSGAGEIRDWMILDWDALHREISDANNGEHFVTDAAPEIIARIFGTKKQFVAGKPAFELHGSGNNKVFRANFTQAIKGAQWGETPSTSMQLGTDGQLKGMRGSSFKELAARLDKSDEYELLRGEILSIFCDLVLPAHLIDDVEHVEKEVLREKHGKQRDVQTIRRIVLARVRLLQERKPEVISEIKKEMRKRPDEHGVIGFIRALPQGRRANAEQRELCRRNLGKELAAEGETYVREHKRGGNVDKGEVNGVQGHRAIRRNVGGGIVQAAGLPRPSISK